jgi:hypothetical protein
MEVRLLAFVVCRLQEVALFPPQSFRRVFGRIEPCAPRVRQVRPKHPGYVRFVGHREHRSRRRFRRDVLGQLGRQAGLDVLPGVLPVLRVAGLGHDIRRFRIQEQPATCQASAFTGPQAGLNRHRVQ